MNLFGFEAVLMNNQWRAIHRLETNMPNEAEFHMNELKILRNHPRIVQHIPEILSIWRGNVDQKLIESLQHLLRYLLKYVLKPEQGSQTFTNILKSLTEDAADDCQVRKVFQKIIMRTTSEHDVSRPECFKLFSDQKFVKFSRPFRCVNILDTRRVNTESEDNIIATKENRADIYWKR